MYSLLLKAFTLCVLSASILVLGAELESVSIEISNADISSTIPNDDSADHCFKDVVCKTETDYIKEFKIEPVRWTLNKPVTLTFRTTDKSDRWRFVNLAVHQVLEREGSDVPKHVFKGFILRGLPDLEVQPKMKYKATFVPPYFWKSGKYLLTLSLRKDGRDWEETTPGGLLGYNTFEQEFVVQAAAEADITFDKVDPLPLPDESSPDGVNRQNHKDTTDIETDTFRTILSNLRSPSDVCNFCQSFSSARKNCKTIFDTTIHQHKPLSAVSLQQICSIGRLETKLHELKVKYKGLPLSFTDRPENKKAWIDEAKQDFKGHELFWTQTTFLTYVTKYLSGLLDEAAGAMGVFFIELGLLRRFLEMPVYGLQTIPEINRVTNELMELPTKQEFKEKLMEKFFHKYKDRLALLGFSSPAGAVSIILKNEQIVSEDEPEYTKWIQAIMRAWKL